LRAEDKLKDWVEALEGGLGGLSEEARLAAMRPAGAACARQIKRLCEGELGREIGGAEDLITGWNLLRRARGLKPGWRLEPGGAAAELDSCSCPLVRSGLVRLQPARCTCSQAMLETIFGEVVGRPVAVEIRESVGRGGSCCRLVVRW
jgi:hypothetical protein